MFIVQPGTPMNCKALLCSNKKGDGTRNNLVVFITKRKERVESNVIYDLFVKGILDIFILNEHIYIYCMSP